MLEGNPSAQNVLNLISRMEMRQALFACHMYMQKIERDGGVDAVIQDIKEASGTTLTAEQVKHAMACGGAIMMMLMGAAYKAAHSGGDVNPSEEPGDLKSEQDAERAAREAIDRIRKLH